MAHRATAVPKDTEAEERQGDDQALRELISSLSPSLARSAYKLEPYIPVLRRSLPEAEVVSVVHVAVRLLARPFGEDDFFLNTALDALYLALDGSEAVIKELHGELAAKEFWLNASKAYDEIRVGEMLVSEQIETVSAEHASRRCGTRQRGAGRPRATRRVTTSSSTGPPGLDDEPVPARRLALAPPPRACYSFACLSAAERGEA